MSILLSSAAAVAMLKKEKRTCPHCKKEQAVPKGKRSQIVKCSSCGKEIPPRKSLV